MALHPFAYSCKSPETLTSASRSLSLIVMSLNSLRYGVRLESAAYWVLGRMKTSQCVMPRRPADWPNSGLSGVSSHTSSQARPEERRVGKECGRTLRLRVLPSTYKKKKSNNIIDKRKL